MPSTTAVQQAVGDPIFLRAAHPGERLSLARRAEAGGLDRLDWGLYVRRGVVLAEPLHLAAVAFRRPATVICLLSALSYHGLTTQIPTSVFIGLDAGRHAPRWRWPPIRPVYTSPSKIDRGIIIVPLEGVPVRITDVPRTIAECWKHVDVVGTGVCIEATRTALIERNRTTVDAIVSYTDEYGVTSKVRPYLEALMA